MNGFSRFLGRNLVIIHMFPGKNKNSPGTMHNGPKGTGNDDFPFAERKTGRSEKQNE